jgi:hypothetical protein
MTPRKLVIEVMDDAMADVLRKKTAFEKLHNARRMWPSARLFLQGAIQTEHPDWNAEQVNCEIARRISHGAVNENPRPDANGAFKRGYDFLQDPRITNRRAFHGYRQTQAVLIPFDP